MHDDMLLFSEINPVRTLSKTDATAHFMNRNKYIYAMSDYTVVVKSGTGPKSGTWAGASEALTRGISKVYVRDIDFEGNKDLIARGGIPYRDKPVSLAGE
jgi:predicted Rossmann fold nucleotide-binding protein DprA/Smf involved in DNA uptake